MSDLFWLSEAQLRRIRPFFPLSHGIPRVDDRRVISGIIFVIRKRSALAGCAGRIWPIEYPVQSLCALEPPWSVRPHLRRACWPRRQARLRDEDLS